MLEFHLSAIENRKKKTLNPKDSVWEDWGTLGKIRGITTHPKQNPIISHGMVLEIPYPDLFPIEECGCFRVQKSHPQYIGVLDKLSLPY